MRWHVDASVYLKSAVFSALSNFLFFYFQALGNANLCADFHYPTIFLYDRASHFINYNILLLKREIP